MEKLGLTQDKALERLEWTEAEKNKNVGKKEQKEDIKEFNLSNIR